MRFLETTKYQAKMEGEEQSDKFNKAMIDQDIMINEVVKFSAFNADVPDAKKKKKIDWVDFNQRHGSELAKTSHAETHPFEKDQYVIRQINKFGWRRADAEEQWSS